MPTVHGRKRRRGRPASPKLARPDVPYTMKLPDGRILYVEVPGRLTTPDRSGEVAFLPAGARFLDRVRAVAMQSVGSPSPGHLTTLREALGLTQAEMGAKVGVDKMTVSRWERGALRPSKESLEALDGLRREAVRRGVVLAG